MPRLQRVNSLTSMSPLCLFLFLSLTVFYGTAHGHDIFTSKDVHNITLELKEALNLLKQISNNLLLTSINLANPPKIDMPKNPLPPKNPPSPPKPNPPPKPTCTPEETTEVQVTLSANPKTAGPFSPITLTWNVEIVSGPASNIYIIYLNSYVFTAAFTSIAIPSSGSKVVSMGTSMVNLFEVGVNAGCITGTTSATVEVDLSLASCLLFSVTQAMVLQLLVNALNSALGPSVPAASRTFQGGFVFVFDNPSSAQVTINPGSVQFNFDLDVSVPDSGGWVLIHGFGDFHVSYSATATVAAVNGAVQVSIISDTTYVSPPTSLEIIGWLVAPGAAQIATNIIDQVMASNINPLLGSKVGSAIQTAVTNLVQSKTNGLFGVFVAVVEEGKIVLTVCPEESK